jgi:hypothetical protein
VSKTNWVCFDCREAVRRPGYTSAAVLCPVCGRQCRNIGDRLRLPSKRAIKGWEVLRASLQAQGIAAAERRQRYRVRSIHNIEREIARLVAMPANESRRKRISSLRKRLLEL